MDLYGGMVAVRGIHGYRHSVRCMGDSVLFQAGILYLPKMSYGFQAALQRSVLGITHAHYKKADLSRLRIQGILR